MKKRSKYGTKLAQFLDIAYKDYLAARVLLNAQLLPQGAVLASTAVEKYFKAILAFRGNESRGHLKNAHLNAAKNFDPRLNDVLNDDFLLLLRRAYSLRYLDELAVDFNLVIAAREFLAELDFTACMIHDMIVLIRGEEKLEQSYHYHKRQKDPRLFSNNYVLMEVDKQSFVSAEPQLVYEVRNCPFRGVLEALYVTAPSPSDGKFLRAAYTPLDDKGMSYKFAFESLDSVLC